MSDRRPCLLHRDGGAAPDSASTTTAQLNPENTRGKENAQVHAEKQLPFDQKRLLLLSSQSFSGEKRGHGRHFFFHPIGLMAVFCLSLS